MTYDIWTMVGVIVFWGSALAVVFAYAGYPALIVVAARVWGRRPVPPRVSDAALPSVTILIAANNEEKILRARIENALEADYPAGRLEIVIASDGSTDRTDERVREFAPRGVRLDSVPERRGKAATLNRVIPTLRSDVVVMSDANTFTEPDSVHNLARWFVDPAIAAVCGKLLLVDHATRLNADGLYWRIETALKAREAQLGALIGSNGAIYALRRSSFVAIPDDTIVDDLVLPLKARLATGGQLVFDQDALAIEETAPDVATEFKRRARIGTGGFKAIAALWRLLDPRHGWIALSFFSHKVLRWICPFFLIALLAANIPLASRPLYAATLALQLAFHGTAALSLRPGIWRRVPRPLHLAAMFDSMNLALLVGFWRWLQGGSSGRWHRTERVATSAPARLRSSGS